MLLNEFMYFSKDPAKLDDDMSDDKRYDPKSDELNRLQLDATRKTRLTLKDINKMRKASEARDQEIAEETELVQAQYAIPVQPAE